MSALAPLARYTRFPDVRTRELFIDEVLRQIGGRYVLDSGEEVEGTSLSYLRTALSSRLYGAGDRAARWTGLSRYGDFVEALREAGFRVVRGRGYRYFRGGSFKPGQPCDVVTL